MSRLGPAVVDLGGLQVAPMPGAAPVLKGIDLQLAAGEQVAVIGASGAGKTTLLLALAGMLRPSAGRLALFGQEPWTLGTAARQRQRARALLAPQVPPLPPRQRVVTAVLAARLPQMSLWASLRTLWTPRLADAERVQRALVALDLPDKLWLRVDRLSGGERQRVGLARLLVADANLWLVDEPLSALDPARAELVMRRLTETARAEGRTLVCSLHQVEVARRCFPRTVALREGRVVYDGPSDGLDDARLQALYGGAVFAPQAPPLVELAPLTALLPQAMCR
ncbi:phosphonate ABC transporter ATP-binding protein [Sphaerotilus montanus]|uniref:Phosphonate transport system ATP-binding protein n=2 Tax=Sphaerotilus montanus TaxID=522889 RepID=A0A7Y9R006_9BURK|nr:ATP-binding cassette domain-containing protein [Sphaerotilus montanus]NYG33769.1 phosphonate transport system ATP-binding protein [Sphaerotilus montanus]